MAHPISISLTIRSFSHSRIPWNQTHISHVRVQGDHNNNKMERMNGEIRDRREDHERIEKRLDTPILTGYQIYHNYMRPHEGLDGKTPAEAWGTKRLKELTNGGH